MQLAYSTPAFRRKKAGGGNWMHRSKIFIDSKISPKKKWDPLVVLSTGQQRNSVYSKALRERSGQGDGGTTACTTAGHGGCLATATAIFRRAVMINLVNIGVVLKAECRENRMASWSFVEKNFESTRNLVPQR
eukprot:EG_transcript_6126